MMILVHIDLSNANIVQFETYEKAVLALLAEHGARLEERIRSIDGLAETHLLFFPDAAAFSAFRSNPARTNLQELWVGCGASTTLSEVVRIN